MGFSPHWSFLGGKTVKATSQRHSARDIRDVAGRFRQKAEPDQLFSAAYRGKVAVTSPFNARRFGLMCGRITCR